MENCLKETKEWNAVDQRDLQAYRYVDFADSIQRQSLSETRGNPRSRIKHTYANNERYYPFVSDFVFSRFTQKTVNYQVFCETNDPSCFFYPRNKVGLLANI